MRVMMVRYGLALLLLLPPLVARADELNLTFVTAEPPSSPDAAAIFRPWAERVMASAPGAVKIDVRDGTAIVNPINIYDRVQSDVFQIGLLIPGLVGGKFPLTEIVSLPFMTDDSVNASLAFWRLYKTGVFDAEYKDITPLGVGLFPPQGVHLAKEPASLDDLKGLRLRVVSKTGSDTVTRLGGTPLVMDPGDQYPAIQRGMLDGLVSSWLQIGPLHLGEVTHFHIETSIGTSLFMVFMAKPKHDALLPAVRKAIDENSGEALTRVMAASYEKRAADTRGPVAAGTGQKVVSLTPAQSEKWRAAIAPVITEWTEAHPGGAALIQRYRTILADVKADK
jgi:TRAP-type C4-dicarboxylate transport system substrate-binding protein